MAAWHRDRRKSRTVNQIEGYIGDFGICNCGRRVDEMVKSVDVVIETRVTARVTGWKEVGRGKESWMKDFRTLRAQPE